MFGLCLEIVQYIANSLLDVFKMDLSYFRQVAPVTDDILGIVMAVGWALLLGNMVFQATKSMVTGLGFEGEDPKLLFTRTFVFGFLLLASQQICEIGLGISSQIIELLQIPTSVAITVPDANIFAIASSWLLVTIVGSIIMWQFVRLFFEIAERYVVTAVLVILSPLAFAMGGSKNTQDIFKGWCRMFGSMCVMMVLNVVFLKLFIAAMGYKPTGAAVLPWTLLIVGIARVARKIDSIIARLGLNPAITGDGLGRGLPGMMAYAVVKGIGSSIAKTAGRSTGKRRYNGTGRGGSAAGPRTSPPPPPPPPGSSGGATFSGAHTTATQQERTQTDARFGVSSAQKTAQGDAAAAGQPPHSADSGAGKTPVSYTKKFRRSSAPPTGGAGTQAPRGRSAVHGGTTGTTGGQHGTVQGGAGRNSSVSRHPDSHTRGTKGTSETGQHGTAPRSSPRITSVTAGQD